MVKQGDIIKVNINPQAGHERAGYRLALVITNDFFNQKANVTMVCPIISTDNQFPLQDRNNRGCALRICESVGSENSPL